MGLVAAAALYETNLRKIYFDIHLLFEWTRKIKFLVMCVSFIWGQSKKSAIATLSGLWDNVSTLWQYLLNKTIII
jgi:hypothetical protein